MDVITSSQLRALIEAGTPPCVSIFMPTHAQGRDVRQDPIEFKNLLRDAEQQLENQGMRPTLARDLLEPARLLLDDEKFWLHSGAGLAVFVSEGFFRAYRVKIEVEASATVSDHFTVKPLLPLMTDRLFYVLAVSQHAVRLIECTHMNCRQVDLPDDVAKSLDAAVQGEDEHQTTTQRHSMDTSNPFSAGGAFHGQADLFDSQHEDLMFYLRQLDNGVQRTIKDPDAYIVLAGDINITPSYKQASKLRNITEDTIRGNPEHVANQVLHEKAVEILQPIWHNELNQQQERFGTALAQKIASHKVDDILEAALVGRVDTLFVAPNKRSYGYIEPQTMTVDVHPEPMENDEDLIDRATVQTLLTSGTIVVVEAEQMPGNGDLAAIYRY